MSRSQDQEIVELTADSGVESGLDKGGVEGNGEQGEAFRTRRPPTAAESGTSPTSGEVSVGVDATGEDVPRLAAGRTTRSVGEAVPKRSLGTRTIENPRSGCKASVSADPSAACGGTCPTSGEKFTNEPELHEDVIRTQAQEIVEVTADSGIESGLDNVADMLGAGGREEDAIGDPELDEADRVGDEATGDDGRRPVAGRTTRSVGEAVPKRSFGARRVEDSRSESGSTFRTPRPPDADRGESVRARRPPTAALGGTSPTTGPARGEDDELRELQAQLAVETVKRQARAGPMAEAIRDLMASSPEAMEILKAFLPG